MGMGYRSSTLAAFAAPTLMVVVSAISGCGSSSKASDTAATPAVAATAPPSTTPAPAPKPAPAPAPKPAPTPAPPPAPKPAPAPAPPPAPKPAPPPAPPPVAPPLSASNNGDACIAAPMPAADALFNSSKRVFAHYVSTFPVSIDNAASATDYYNEQYLSKTGESGKWLKQGGFLRQRPLGVAAGAKSTFQLLNMEREVRAAIARGITGFTFNSMSATDATDSGSVLHDLLAAAHAVDSRFKIVIMPDITVLGTDSNAVVQIIASVAGSPAAYRLSDGRLVVSAFDAGLNPPSWWQSVISRLNSQGIQVAFVPTFVSWPTTADAFAAFSYGFGDWGTATVAGAGAMEGDPEIIHSTYGKIFMMPVDPQQYRPKGFNFWEASNSAAFRGAWSASIQGDADWVQMVTWNDFSESSGVAPATDATLQRNIGTGFYNLTGYYAAWFLTGHEPRVTHDVLYYFYRREATGAAAPAQSQKDSIVTGLAENDIELLAFLTSPGVLKITIGGKTYTQNAAAGVVSFKVPTQAGIPLFTLSRSGTDVFSFHGGVQIYGSAGLPSGVQDFSYWSGSASKTGICAL
jgi:Glycosyl hydrolase family 71